MNHFSNFFNNSFAIILTAFSKLGHVQFLSASGRFEIISCDVPPGLFVKGTRFCGSNFVVSLNGLFYTILEVPFTLLVGLRVYGELSNSIDLTLFT